MHQVFDLCPDRASRHFLDWPTHPYEIEVCLGIPAEMACRVFQVGLRLSPVDRLTWLNDVALAVMSNVPLRTIKAWMVFAAKCEPLWKREA